MAAPVVLTIVRVAGAVHTTYKLAKAGLDALSNGSATDHVDPVGNQTVRKQAQRGVVGLTLVRQTVRAHEIPESPRGQFMIEFLLRLRREGPAEPTRVRLDDTTLDRVQQIPPRDGGVGIARGPEDDLIDATIEVTPLWAGLVDVDTNPPSSHGPLVELNAATLKVENVPYGESTAAGFLLVDGSQAFMHGGSQQFFLRAKIASPTESTLWTKQGSPYNPLLTTPALHLDFDYFHLPWE